MIAALLATTLAAGSVPVVDDPRRMDCRVLAPTAVYPVTCLTVRQWQRLDQNDACDVVIDGDVTNMTRPCVWRARSWHRHNSEVRSWTMLGHMPRPDAVRGYAGR